MPLAEIKNEFKNKRVAFGNSAAPLYQRQDIDELAILALESQDSSLLRLFQEPLPELSILKKNKTDIELKKIAAGKQEAKK
jgi:hypothetical protein